MLHQIKAPQYYADFLKSKFSVIENSRKISEVLYKSLDFTQNCLYEPWGIKIRACKWKYFSKNFLTKCIYSNQQDPIQSTDTEKLFIGCNRFVHGLINLFRTGRNPKWVVLQAVKTQMKCCMMQHFIRVCTVCYSKIDIQRKIQIFWEVIAYDPSIYTMEHPYFIVCSFMENSIGLKRVRAHIWCNMEMFQASR